MAPPSRIRIRRTAAQLHALEQVEKEIRATDPHPRRKYLRDFTEAYTRYSAVLTPAQLSVELNNADVLLVGDYHALPRCQEFTAELVEQLRASGKKVILGLEMIFSRDQRILDDWQKGRITDEELRHRIRHDAEWGYAWEPTLEMLQRARTAGAAIRGLDCLPRGDLRRISGRDRHAALQIAEIRSERPDATMIVLFGESHLAPAHLPKLVRAALPEAKVLTVLQNVDALYWQASGEPGDAVRAVRVDDETVCVFNATPLEKYERYRLCIERWRQERPGAPDVAPTFYNLVYALLRFLRIDEKFSGYKTHFADELLPYVVAVGSGDELAEVLARPQRSALTAGPATAQAAQESELRDIRDRLREAGCLYLPSLNTLLVEKFEIAGAAEEAARFICCSGWGDVGLPGSSNAGEKLFYRTCLQYALIECGSRILYPGREPLREYDLYALYNEEPRRPEQRPVLGTRDYMRLVDFIVLHRDFECHARRYREVPALIREGRAYSAQKFAIATHWLGRLLGAELYECYLRGSVRKRTLRSLFLRRTNKPKAAYFRLVQLCRRQRSAQ